jgi:hypothetical protein
MYLLVSVLIAIMIASLLYKKQQIEQNKRDAIFNQIMLALEEKAKKDGTFQVSYFDKKS